MKRVLASLIILISSLTLSAQSSVPLRKSNTDPGENNPFKIASNSGFLEKPAITQVLIFPNPAISFVRVSLYSSEGKPAQVILLDNIGNKIQESSYELSTGQNILTLNLEEQRIKPGVYFLRIQFLDEQITRKLVIRE